MIGFYRIAFVEKIDGDGDKLCGDNNSGDGGHNFTGMGWVWGCKLIPMSFFNLYLLLLIMRFTLSVIWFIH